MENDFSRLFRTINDFTKKKVWEPKEDIFQKRNKKIIKMDKKFGKQFKEKIH